MSLYYNSYVLDKYLSRYRDIKEPRIRMMQAEEYETVQKLMTVYKNFAKVIVELLTIQHVLKGLGYDELDTISLNLQRIIVSMSKHRAKLYLVKSAFCTIRPSPEEFKEIEHNIIASERRIAYLKETAIKDNLKLTPIQAYLEEIGVKDIHTDLRTKFPDMKGHKEGKATEEYAKIILDTVREAGRMEEHEKELAKYLMISRKHKETLEREAMERRMKEERKIAEDGMLSFQQMFHSSVIDCKTCSTIHCGYQTIIRRINKYGRNSWIIFECYAHRGRPIYRYITASRGSSNNFAQAFIFSDEGDAEKVKAELMAEHPDHLYEVVKLSHIERETA